MTIFDKLEKTKKKELCLDILSEARKNKWWLFEELSILIEEDRATDTDLWNIYQSAMELLEESNEQERQKAIGKLEDARLKLIEVRKKEEQEKLLDQQNAYKLLNNLI